MPKQLNPALSLGLIALTAACASGPAPASSPAPDAPTPGAEPPSPVPTVQPGAPGEASREIDAQNIADLGGVEYVQADVDFMQGMIPHHAQALQMTHLAARNTRSSALRSLALRMEISQRDEIAMMATWLRERGEEVPESAAFTDDDVVLASIRAIESGSGGMTMSAEDHAGMDHAAMGHDMEEMGDAGGMSMMPGMLSADQMQALAAATDAEFDRLFLEYMIQHHEGAILMVNTLFDTDGAAQESEIFQFASHVDADQRAEIARMSSMLADRRQ